MFKDATIISVIAALIQLMFVTPEVYMTIPFVSRDTGLTFNQLLMIITFFIVFVSVIISKYIPFI